MTNITLRWNGSNKKFERVIAGVHGFEKKTIFLFPPFNNFSPLFFSEFGEINEFKLTFGEYQRRVKKHNIDVQFKMSP